ATVESTARPEDQLLVCRVASTGSVRAGRTDLDVALPWATDGPPLHGYREGAADISGTVFQRAGAQQVARMISGDDLLTLRLTGLSPRTEAAGHYWSRTFDYLMQALLAADGDAIIEAALVRYALVTTLSTFPSTF